MPTETSTARSRMYKNQGRDGDEMRRRRQETSVELRKARKEDQLSKRRNFTVLDEPTSPLQDATNKVCVRSANMPQQMGCYWTCLYIFGGALHWNTSEILPVWVVGGRFFFFKISDILFVANAWNP